MTKWELRAELCAGKSMDDLFRFSCGQECFIFKSTCFVADDHICYIPDTDLNNIPIDVVMKYEDIDEVISMCYTGNDFVKECDGNVEMAERLFWYVDWQHPSSAVDEVCGLYDDEDDEENEVWPASDRHQKLLLAVVGWLKANFGESATVGNLYGIGFTTEELVNLGFDSDEVEQIAQSYDDLPWI